MNREIWVLPPSRASPPRNIFWTVPNLWRVRCKQSCWRSVGVLSYCLLTMMTTGQRAWSTAAGRWWCKSQATWKGNLVSDWPPQLNKLWSIDYIHHMPVYTMELESTGIQHFDCALVTPKYKFRKFMSMHEGVCSWISDKHLVISPSLIVILKISSSLIIDLHLANMR